MQRQSLVWVFALILIGVFLLFRVAHAPMGRYPVASPAVTIVNPGMGYPGDTQTIHQLFANHNLIERTVTAIPKGIRTVTESHHPEVAALIQAHVSEMYDRVNRGQPIPMIAMSSTLPILIRSANQYQRQLRLTAQGIEITETSSDPDLVAAICEHAEEVTQFIQQGMPAMMKGGMRAP
ncbi:MAG: hypothetical protein KME16_13075 [Scytolyngbya sp. HA4215-MV1]|nr:hypothetical protein [Scytolyngbya sp. HA4215-MV1]